MPNSTNDIRDLQRLPILGGLDEMDGYEPLWCSDRSCALAGPTCP
jgi:hypothetical protein